MMRTTNDDATSNGTSVTMWLKKTCLKKEKENKSCNNRKKKIEKRNLNNNTNERKTMIKKKIYSTNKREEEITVVVNK